MALHRYWRFLINSAGRAGDVCSIAEIGAASTVGGVNGLIGSTVTASSILSGGFVASNVLDGSLTTMWASNNTSGTNNGEWVKFDLGLGNDKDLSAEMWATVRSDGFEYQMAISGYWQWSDDNVNWTTALIYNFTGNLGPSLSIYTPQLVGSYLDGYRKVSQNLSGRNLIATSSGAGGIRANRNVRGLVYFEGTITTLTGTPQIGLAQTNWNNTTALGTGTDTLGYQPGGQVRINNVTLGTIAAYAAGNRIGVAVDYYNRLIWFRVNGGNWNNGALNDPATGIGGIDFSSMLAGTFFPAFSASLTGTVWTTAFLTFVDTAPTGFVALSAADYLTADIGKANLETLDPVIIGEVSTDYGFTAHLSSGVQKYFSPAGPVTHVSGLCEESGVPVAGRLVEVFDRYTGDRLDYALSAVDGSWSCVCLGRPSVRIVGSDPTAFNSQVYDNVVPV